MLAEYAAAPDEATHYRTSEAYLYDLTVFAMSETKLPYLRDLTQLVPPPARVLDYGCGIGSDGLRLLEAGYDVSFADFDNPSIEYLRWRLRERGIAAHIYDLDGEAPGLHDAVYAFDVIEHVPDPYTFLQRLEDCGELVCVNLLRERPEEAIALHRTLPVGRLLAHAACRRIVRYRRYHGRSHLVFYRAGRAPLRSALALAGGRLRSGRPQ
jgi:SAM-dependent methyltransferase